MIERILTGITTTGTPHLGNYVGAIAPTIAASQEPGVESFVFLADYHALIKCDNPERIERSRLEIAAAWLAAGLDPERVTLYRQSDVPQITELAWLLTCVTAKGHMNRAHAYKAAVDANTQSAQEEDANISMGLFSYPILMAADILLFNAHRVPVGPDQVQHIEMARDIAQRFNHQFGHQLSHQCGQPASQGPFVLPRAQVQANATSLPGLDGRKMSKSYGNTVPLFEGGLPALRRSIAQVVTDSRLPGEPKDPNTSHLVSLFDAFALPKQRQQLREKLAAGLAWGEAKEHTVALIDAHLGPMRERYAQLMAHPERIEIILQQGAQKARAWAAPFLAQLRYSVGLRPMTALAGAAASNTVSKPSTALASFKQYRESSGEFFFKLVAFDGTLLLQSHAFGQGREAGAWVQQFKTKGRQALPNAPVNLMAPASQVHAALDALLSE
jgi:tryptophanyl-tRNA synthetase